MPLIEQNSLSIEQVTAVLNSKHVLSPSKDISELKNAFQIYYRLNKLTPYSIDDFLLARSICLFIRFYMSIVKANTVFWYNFLEKYWLMSYFTGSIP